MIFYIISFILIKFLIYYKRDFLIKKYNIYDLPDQNRKNHKFKISVIGGAIIQINIIFLLFFIIFFDVEFPKFIKNNRNLFSIFFISFCIFLTGMFDDKLLIENKAKFLILSTLVLLTISIDQSTVLTSIKFSWMNREILLLSFSTLFTALCILTFMNSFNFMDGIDLLCGIYALFVFIIFFYLTKSLIFLPFIFSLILFCFLNYKKVLFFGDSGALLVSFLISLFSIKIYKLNLIYTEQILILFLIPILDNMRVFYKRFIRQQNLLIPNTDHLHHILFEKFNLLITLIIILGLIFIPFFISVFTDQIFYILMFFQIMLYLIIILKFKRN